MTPGMTVTVTEYEPSPTVAIRGHQPSEGIGDPIGEHEFNNAYNIEQHIPGDGSFPRVVVRDSDGDHSFSTAVADVSQTDPLVKVVAIRDTTASDVFNRTVELDAYGFQTATVENTFGDETTVYSAFIQKHDGEPTVLHASTHRGYIVTYPDGTTKHYGDTSRHSKTAQHKFEDTRPHGTPYKTGDGHMTVYADGDTYSGVVNVTRPEPSEYVLHTALGNTVRVSEIDRVEGALYTVGVRHEDTYGVAVTTAQNAMGVYVSAEHNFGSDDPAVFAVGHPDSAGIHKTPYLHQLTKVERVENVFVKHPDGTVTTGVENIPNVDGT